VTGTPAVELRERLTEALGAHDVHPDDRAEILNGYLEAGGDSATWDDLSPRVKGLITDAEALPAQSWDDPADVPDHVFIQ
jgi:hypothetical protein